MSAHQIWCFGCHWARAAISAAVVAAVTPAYAQGLFVFLQAPAELPSDSAVPPRARPKVARPKAPAVKMPARRKAVGALTNPFPELLVDETLRPGDIVVFADGVRVFSGRKKSVHSLSDFQPAFLAGKELPRSTRTYVAQLTPGWNGAWSLEQEAGGGRGNAEAPTAPRPAESAAQAPVHVGSALSFLQPVSVVDSGMCVLGVRDDSGRNTSRGDRSTMRDDRSTMPECE